MKILKSALALLTVLSAALLISGCLVSGTFTIVEEFSFTSANDIYFYPVDVTDEEEWEDHKDDIDWIDIIGFELWITNNQVLPDTLAIYLDDFGADTLTSLAQLQANAVKVFGDLAIAGGVGTQTHVTYGQSLGYIQNVAELRRLAKEGMFHYYGTSPGDGAAGYTIDSVRVVLTFEASGGF